MDNMITILNKNKLIDSLNERINFFQGEIADESKIKIKELQELLYIINKGCFDIDICNNIK